jgi:hypothetical protein
MDVTLNGMENIAVAGATDTRGTALGTLAGQGARVASDSLKHVVPSEETARVSVAAFGSSI